jgi:hypothetical protein
VGAADSMGARPPQPQTGYAPPPSGYAPPPPAYAPPPPGYAPPPPAGYAAPGYTPYAQQPAQPQQPASGSYPQQ